MSGIQVSFVGPEHAAGVLAAIRAAFGARPALDPPSTALDETEASVSRLLAEHGGLVAERDGEVVGAALLEVRDTALGLRRVSVLPHAQRSGVAAALAAEAEAVAVTRGLRRIVLTARAELPGTVAFWRRVGFVETGRDGTTLTLTKELPVVCEVATGEAMRALGERLAGVVRRGDLLILSGGLGAGKTTFTQGLGHGLGVRGDVTSPTFVICRIHPSLGDGPSLVHVDAYRLGPGTGSGSATAELDDLDLDVLVPDAVTVIEWGAGLAEGLADDRLEVTITRPHGASPDGEQEAAEDSDQDAAEPRRVTFTPVGARWAGSGLADLVT